MSAGVDIDAGNRAVDMIKNSVQSTFNANVLTGIGSFGSLFDLKEILSKYDHPVLVQSIDGVGTKVIVARMMHKYDTIGIDLVSACANDIIVMGARPLTFLDYIANDRLKPEVIAEMVKGMATACKESGIALVGGETAEMPDTYLAGEHDLVGVITGVAEKDKIISGDSIVPGDVVLGLPSSGLHTNGYSLARKLFFDVGGYEADDTISGLEKSVGETLLEPHINYTNHVFSLLDNGVPVKGMAHITGGGLQDNLQRVLPHGCRAVVESGSWPVPEVFDWIAELGQVETDEMYRVFNMGIGFVLVLDPYYVESVQRRLGTMRTESWVIGRIDAGETGVERTGS